MIKGDINLLETRHLINVVPPLRGTHGIDLDVLSNSPISFLHLGFMCVDWHTPGESERSSTSALTDFEESFKRWIPRVVDFCPDTGDAERDRAPHSVDLRCGDQFLQTNILISTVCGLGAARELDYDVIDNVRTGEHLRRSLRDAGS
jgi:hypothetical protein